MKFNHIVEIILIPLLAWMCVALITTKESVARMESQQIENTRVNNIVYGMSDNLIRIETELKYLNEHLEDLKDGKEGRVQGERH